MNDALARQCELLRLLLAKATSDEIGTRYRIGTIVMRVQDAPKRFGVRAIDRLAIELAYDRTTLWRHACVARSFDRKSIDRLLATAKSRRAMVSWSHLVLLATVGDLKVRAALLEQALAGASVRHLEAALRQTGDGEHVSGAVRSLRQLLAVTENLKGRVAAADVEVDIEGASPDAEETLELLRQLHDSHHEMREICDRRLQQLDQMRSALTRQLHERPHVVALPGAPQPRATARAQGHQ